MSFLAPFFLAGLAAIAAPIIFHLIRKSVKERVRFSTLMFLKESPPKLTKRSHLENLLLLAIRCLILILLAGAFARPYFRQAVTAPPAAGSGLRTVVLLDTSASMRREGVFEAAKRAATAAIQKASGNSAVAVIAFDASPRTLFSFEQWQRTGGGERVAGALAQVEAAAPTWQSTHIGKALTTAAEMVLDAAHADADASTRSQLIVITDAQQGARLDGLQGFEWPKGCEVIWQSVAPPGGNAGVQTLAAAPGEGLSVTNTRLRARVVNAANAKGEQFKIGWAAPGAATFMGAPLELHVPAGQNRSIALPTAPTNAPQLSILLQGDAEAFDNRAYHAEPPRQTLRVTYIGADKEEDPASQLFYLRRAFSETAGLAVRVEAREGGGGKPIEGGLAIVSALNPGDVGPLKEHLAAGKTAFVTASENMDLSPLAAITEGAAPAMTEAGGNYVMLAQIDFDHPLFAQFRDARFNDFTKIHFWKHRKLDLAALPKARVIAAFDDNSPALVQLPVAKGSIYLLSAGWNPGDSQFALSSKFVPFLYSLLEQTAPVTTQARQLVVGDSVPYPGEFPGETIALTKPDGTIAPWKKGESFAIDQPGFYTATTPALMFAANLDPAESRTAPLAEEQLASLGLPMKLEEAVVSPKEKEHREQLLLATEQESRQKLWRRLLLVALGLLLLESIVARVHFRRPQTA
jgi:hypothetical protein